MNALSDPHTLGRARLSFADEAEVDEFVSTLGRFERGEIGPDEWRAYRLVRGVYGQRQDGVSMVRVKIPEGALSAPQLRTLAEVARRYSRGFGHITTRQNIQFHFVKPEDLDPALHLLAQAGLTTREACGNSVRNITACPYAGVAADEVFDVTPYAEAMTRYLLRHPLSARLPRKFKIAWEGCPEDHAALPIHDIGWQAVMGGEDGVAGRGFRVTVGGGTATLCRAGRTLFDFLPAPEVLSVAEAVLRVYHRRGDYQHKQRNRLKFLIETMGWEPWRAEVVAELYALRAAGGVPLPFDAEHPPVEQAPRWARPMPLPAGEVARRVHAEPPHGPGILPETPPATTTFGGGYEHWARTNVRRQQQDGYSLVTITVPLGDLTAAQMEALADLAAAYGDGAPRLTSEQDLVLRWVEDAAVSELHLRLTAAGLGHPDANTVADVVSCPGAESCRLAVTQSRGLGRILGDQLRGRPDLVAAAPDLSIKISGCPNGCGRHHIAGIGFQGSVRRLGKRALPQYFVFIGGGGDTFGRLVAKVPARRMKEVVERLIGVYVAERQDGESAPAFFARLSKERAREALADLERLTAEEAQPEDFVDLGATEQFKVEAMEGECSA